ncbi:probable calcium-binding protein CML11 [Oryza glaberrima]|uniref:EF-hand domain-containing protein n=1 Tax=Oryza glaberrima TaxID=4538 RepID=I1NNG1_ORYGL|nr:probable calcium-binding protein CML11 [Oryza glaberrima]
MSEPATTTPTPTPAGDHDAAATACKPAETTTALITCRSSSCSAQQQQQQEEPLGDDQLGELREIFRSFDRNGDGSLTQLELGSLLRSLGLKPSTDELDSLIQRADTNSNGLIEFSEFVALVAPELLYDRAPYSEDQIRRLFNIFDRDGNGFITAAELAHSMAKLGHALTVKELTGMIKEADTDGDGRISFQEFSRAITAAAFDNIFS